MTPSMSQPAPATLSRVHFITGEVRMRIRTVLTAAAAALTTTIAGLAVAPAHAANRVTPGSFTGFAFDACQAPTQGQMDRWRTTSPFWAVGVYIGGAERLCAQPNLDKRWVTRQSTRGWKILPIWVGPQTSCSGYGARIDAAPASSYSKARAQGRSSAYSATRTARALGIPKRSTIWYDLEDFDLAETHCRRSALSFLSAWTKRLHGLGYRSGVYANVAGAVHALDNADKLSSGSYLMPDQIWYAWDNGRANTYIAKKWVRARSWAPHRRIHQYRLDTTATYGNVRLHVDRNFMDVGRGSVAPRAPRSCGVRVSFPDYPARARGSRGALVKAAQCLLKQKRVYRGRVDGRYDRATYRAVRAFQNRADLRVTGRVSKSTWTALLPSGSSPVLKRGSASNAVRRVQRALNAALKQRVAVTGVFGSRTTSAVLRYQRNRGLPRTGVVASGTWRDLENGRV